MAGPDAEHATTGSSSKETSEKPKSSPPLETPAVSSTRQWIVFSFWIVVACFGLPHWLWTTSIHRSNLPLELMNQWAEGKACQISYPLDIRIDSPSLNGTVQHILADRVQAKLGALPNFRLYEFHVATGNERLLVDAGKLPSAAESEPALTVRLESRADSVESAESRSWEPVLDIGVASDRVADVESLGDYVAEKIESVFRGEEQSISHLLSATPFASDRESVLGPSERANLDSRTTRAFKYASTYHVTFSLFTAASTPSAWEIEDALADYISPLLSKLSAISEFTVETQVQLHASLSPSLAGPHYNPAAEQWELRKSDLSGFVNAAEWPLSPSIGSGPTINFVLYVPAKERSPLVLAETGGTSWLIPQWGGVQILNPKAKQQGKLTLDDLTPAMLVFADQLTALLGIPQNPPSLALRLSSLARERATSLIISASSTLGALSRLTLKLTSIAIPDTVAKSVDETITRLDQACADLRAGRFDTALQNARVAEAEAEQAFFEPSMVGQVYFPDEHKVAVYVPLLGPMAVPMVMAGIKELRKLRRGKQKTA